MAADLPGIVVCRDCGCVNEDETALKRELLETVDLLERDLRIRRAQIKKLMGEAADKLQRDIHYPKAKRVLEHWKALCHPRAVAPVSDARLAPTLARLREGYSEEQLIQCVEGYAKRPYVIKGGRSATGEPGQRHVDPELIFRSGKYVDAGIRMAAIAQRDNPVDAGQDWRAVKRAHRRVLVEALRKRYGDPINEDGYLLFPCPWCEQMRPDYNRLSCSLRVAPDGLSWIADCSTCHQDERRLIRAIREDEDV